MPVHGRPRPSVRTLAYPKRPVVDGSATNVGATADGEYSPTTVLPTGLARAGGAGAGAATGLQLSNLGLLGDLERVVDLNPQISHRRLQLRVPEQELHGPEVLGALVDQRRLGAPHRMRAVVGGVEAQLPDPAAEDARVLPCAEVRRSVLPAREQEVLGPQARLLDPPLHGLAGHAGDLELNRALRLVLHHDGPGRDLVPVTDVPDSQADQVAASQLAVDAQVEQRELTNPVLHLQADAQRPDVLGLERRLLADDLALVPWLSVGGVGGESHDGLPSS